MILANSGVEKVGIIDASTGVCIVKAFVNNVNGQGLTIEVPHDDEDYRKWEHLQRHEWNTVLWAKRLLLHRRFNGDMSKDVLICTMRSAIQKTRQHLGFYEVPDSRN